LRISTVIASVFCMSGAMACTSLMVGPGATKDGSVWVGQSNDGEGAGDTRLVKIPAKDWPVGSMRAIIDYGNFPRYVGHQREVPFYFPGKLNETKNVIGSIPQVNHTFGYIESDYAVSNEQGVAFGESTCSARTFAKSHAAGGPSLLSMYELSRLAAERASTAREAVQVMGALASQHGFYGDPDGATGGESLFVADSEEQFMFHVLAESETVGGAIWAAQRIPRNHVSIVANAFVIGFINASDSVNFLFSSNMFRVAKANGWWDGEGDLHFTRTFSAGEYTSKYYAGRRMWAFYTALAPSANVPAEYKSYVAAIGDTYPVSAAPDTLVQPSDILRKVYRNYYQGTKYDLSQGLAAGPYGTPVRSKPGPAEGVMNNCTDQCSHWERPIAVFRTTSIHQTNIRPWHPLASRSVVWFLPGAALVGFFTPTFTSVDEVGPVLSSAANTVMDRSTAMWASKELGQFAYPKWSHVKASIAAAAAKIEEAGMDLVHELDDLHASVQQTRVRCEWLQTEAVAQWQQLYGELLMQFSDGWDYKGIDGGSVALGYPSWWLKKVDYVGGTPACYPTCR